jgi:hypothetical protein
MLRTITIGTCVLVQGVLVREFTDGRIAVRVGEHIFQGIPVERASHRIAGALG